MKKIITVLCLILITGSVANAQPMKAPQYNHEPMPAPHKMAPVPKPVPIAYQIPVQVPVYQNGYNNSPYVTFSLGNIDVTLGL